MSTFGFAHLHKRLLELPRSPCERACSYVERCSAEEISCGSFHAYIRYGISHPRSAEDLPTKDFFENQKIDDLELPGYESLPETRKTLRAIAFP